MRRIPPAERKGLPADVDVQRTPPRRLGSAADIIASVWTSALQIAHASNDPELHPHQHAESGEQ